MDFLRKEIKLPTPARLGRRGARDESAKPSFRPDARARLSSLRGRIRSGGSSRGSLAERTSPPTALTVELPLMRAFNLLPPEDPRGSTVRVRRGGQIAVALTAVLLFAGLASFAILANRDVAQKREAAEALRAGNRQATASRARREVTRVDPALLNERAERTAALATALGSRLPWDRFLRDLSLVLPERVWLSGLSTGAAAETTDGGASAEDATATSTATSLTINGYTWTQDDVARLLARLSVLQDLESVQLLSSTSARLGRRNVVQFSIVASIPPKGGAEA
jgi:Tfp pilus assembly protein PilN